MAVEITQAHLNALNESATTHVDEMIRYVREYARIAQAMVFNPTTPPEPRWSSVDLLTQRTALRTEMTNIGVALAAVAAAMKAAGDAAVADWTP